MIIISTVYIHLMLNNMEMDLIIQNELILLYNKKTKNSLYIHKKAFSNFAGNLENHVEI
jgi:hypothetical protein